MLKERILLVAVEDSKFGENFKAVVQNTWTYNEKIKFVHPQEIKEMLKNRKERKAYAVLDFYKSGSRTNYSGSAIKISLLEKMNNPVHTILMSAMEINSESVTIDNKEDINVADLIFAVKQLHTQIISLTKYEKTDRKEVIKMFQKNNAEVLKRLKTKTLLIEENVFTKKALKEFKANYKYAYEIVTKEVINDAIINSHDDEFYIKGILQMTGFKPNIMTVVTYSIYDSETNEQLYIMIQSGNLKLSKKDIQKFVKNIK